MELNESLEKIATKYLEDHKKIVYALNNNAISPRLGEYFSCLLNMDLIFNTASAHFSNGLRGKSHEFAMNLALEYSKVLVFSFEDDNHEFMVPIGYPKELIELAKNRFVDYAKELNQMRSKSV